MEDVKLEISVLESRLSTLEKRFTDKTQCVEGWYPLFSSKEDALLWLHRNVFDVVKVDMKKAATYADFTSIKADMTVGKIFTVVSVGATDDCDIVISTEWPQEGKLYIPCEKLECCDRDVK